jgi:cytochrome P450
MTTTPAKDRPSGPRGLPLIGSASQVGQGLFGFITENARTYGDVVYFEIVNEPFYQLNHPDDIESVLVENNQQFNKGRLNQELLNPVVGTGLFTSEGETWRNQRHLIQPLFHPNQIAMYGNIMTECIERMLDEWSDEKRIDVHEAMKGLTLEIVARALLGVDIRRDIRSIGRTSTSFSGTSIVPRISSFRPGHRHPGIDGTDGRSPSWNPSLIGSSPSDEPELMVPISCRRCLRPRTNAASGCVLDSYGTK